MATHRPVVATHRRLVALEKAEACARSFASGSVTRMQRGRGRVRLVDVWTGLMALPEFYCVAHLPRQLCCACELCVNDHGRAKTDQSPSYSVCTIIGRRDGIHSFACCREFIKGETSLTTLIQLQRSTHAQAAREIQRLLFRYYKSSTSPTTRFCACGLGSCTLQTRPMPREHRKTAWEEHETSDTSELTRLRRTHTRDSTATFPLLQVEHESKHPVFCMWTRLMYSADSPHAARAPENRVGGA